MLLKVRPPKRLEFAALTGPFRIVALIGVCLSVSLGGLVADMPSAHAAQKPAKAADAPMAGPTLLIDARTGDVLSSNRAGEPWYPASLTKLMTAYVIFQKLRQGTLRLDQQIPVSELAHGQEPSKIGVPTGKTVSVDFALQALLVYSANDMAYVLAEAASGTHENFAKEMNAAAHALGMTATHFVNPNGLFDPRHVSSARDIGVLAAVLYNAFPEHAHYFSQPYVAVGKRKLANRNMLIRLMPDADGMKTGFVCNAGYNLVASATRNGRHLIAVVLGSKSGNARAAVAKRMLEQGFVSLPAGNAPKVADIPNMPQGAIVPADLTTSVCRSKTPVQLADGRTLSGWAVSFGTYDTMMKADMALRGRLLSAVGINTRHAAGVVRLPEKAGYAALLWNVPQAESLSLCTDYRAQGAHCDVVPPALVEQIADFARASAPPPPPPVAQGSEEGRETSATQAPAKRPVVRKRIRKVLR